MHSFKQVNIKLENLEFPPFNKISDASVQLKKYANLVSSSNPATVPFIQVDATATTLPSSVDYRQTGDVSSIKNQG
jgi:hypothetical protein